MPRAEGGYTQRTPLANGRTDPETLFGVIDTNWLRELDALSPSQIARLSPGVARHVREIQAAPESQKLTEVRELMRAIATNFVPFSGATEREGMPPRATGEVRPGRSAAQLADIESMQGLTADILMQRYVRDPGFDRFPQFISAHLIDFGVNKGPARARWALAESLHDIGVLPDDVWQRMPHLTGAQVVDLEGTTFSGGVGSVFAGTAINDALLPYVQDLSPAQQRELVASFSDHRREYHAERARLQPGFERFVPGLNARVERLEDYQRDSLGFGESARETRRPPQPAAPTPRVEPRSQVRDRSLPTASTAPHAPVGERLNLEIQYRRTGGDLAGGTRLLHDAIAIEIPGRGVFTYAIDRSGNYVDHEQLPSGVTLLRAVDSGSALSPGEIANPFPRERTLTWLDSHGHRQYLPLSRDMNNHIAEMDVNYTFGVRTGISGSLGEFDGTRRQVEVNGRMEERLTGLHLNDSDRLVIEQTASGPRYMVYDMDRAGNPGLIVPRPIASDHHPALPPSSRGRD